MSEMTLSVGAILSHLNRMCEHDLERLRKQLSIRAEKTNPECYQCQHQAKRRKLR
ncbi:hypothetical protein [Zhihengliuella halotolerans]|uniref:hypothetical protein n=1 Tax=Zhihengliuella halotolerans TaxID=370736 RepID=UPI0015E0ECA6|nr:hypothetical protein [Zhihengliuella halotolerans]